MDLPRKSARHERVRRVPLDLTQTVGFKNLGRILPADASSSEKSTQWVSRCLSASHSGSSTYPKEHLVGDTPSTFWYGISQVGETVVDLEFVELVFACEIIWHVANNSAFSGTNLVKPISRIEVFSQGQNWVEMYRSSDMSSFQQANGGSVRQYCLDPNVRTKTRQVRVTFAETTANAYSYATGFQLVGIVGVENVIAPTPVRMEKLLLAESDAVVARRSFFVEKLGLLHDVTLRIEHPDEEVSSFRTFRLFLSSSTAQFQEEEGLVSLRCSEKGPLSLSEDAFLQFCCGVDVVPELFQTDVPALCALYTLVSVLQMKEHLLYLCSAVEGIEIDPEARMAAFRAIHRAFEEEEEPTFDADGRRVFRSALATALVNSFIREKAMFQESHSNRRVLMKMDIDPYGDVINATLRSLKTHHAIGLRGDAPVMSPILMLQERVRTMFERKAIVHTNVDLLSETRVLQAHIEVLVLSYHSFGMCLAHEMDEAVVFGNCRQLETEGLTDKALVGLVQFAYVGALGVIETEEEGENDAPSEYYSLCDLFSLLQHASKYGEKELIAYLRAQIATLSTEAPGFLDEVRDASSFIVDCPDYDEILQKWSEQRHVPIDVLRRMIRKGARDRGRENELDVLRRQVEILQEENLKLREEFDAFRKLVMSHLQL